MTQQSIAALLDTLWQAYYDGTKRTIKPPTLSRLTTAVMKNGDDFYTVRQSIKAVLQSGDFISVREKDNCGISWLCWCHKASRFMLTCLTSKNRA